MAQTPDAPLPPTAWVEPSVYTKVLGELHGLEGPWAGRLMRQALRWETDSAVVTVRQALQHALADWQAVEAWEEAEVDGSRKTDRKTTLLKLLAEMDHGPMRLAHVLRTTSGARPWTGTAWRNLVFGDGVFDRTGTRHPRAAAFAIAAIPQGLWRQQGRRGTSFPPQSPTMHEVWSLAWRADVRVHPAVAAAERGLWSTADALLARWPLVRAADRDAALYAASEAAVRGMESNMWDQKKDAFLVNARRWMSQRLAEGADPHRMYVYDTTDPSKTDQRTYGYAAPLVMAADGAAALSEDAWRRVEHYIDDLWWTRRMLQHQALVVSAADRVAAGCASLVQCSSAEGRATWLGLGADLFSQHGGPHGAQPLYPNGTTELAHAYAMLARPKESFHSACVAVMSALLDQWLPAVVATDAARGRAWWSTHPSQDQPWDAWGVAAHMAVHASSEDYGRALAAELLALVPQGTTVPMAYLHRAGAALVAHIRWAVEDPPAEDAPRNWGDSTAGVSWEALTTTHVVVPVGPAGAAPSPHPPTDVAPSAPVRGAALWSRRAAMWLRDLAERWGPAATAETAVWLDRMEQACTAVAAEVHAGRLSGAEATAAALDRAQLEWVLVGADAAAAGPTARAPRVL